MKLGADLQAAGAAVVHNIDFSSAGVRALSKAAAAEGTVMELAVADATRLPVLYFLSQFSSVILAQREYPLPSTLVYTPSFYQLNAGYFSVQKLHQCVNGLGKLNT